jgi:hypothetical protein
MFLQSSVIHGLSTLVFVLSKQFKEHFSNLMNIQDKNIDRDNEPNSEDNVFEELDVPFTEPETERGITVP